MKFDATVNAQYTPFHNLRAGLWNNNMICERLMDEMYDTEAGLKDPRVDYYFDKLVGVPTQITYNELMTYFDVAAHYRRNVIQDRDHFPLMNYSELYFIWAEAAYRGWIAGTPKEYYLTAVSEAVYEWTDNPSADLTSFLSNARVSIDALEGEEVLVKRKVTKRDVPPDIQAVKMLLDGEADIAGMSDEELEERRKKLIEMLKEDKNEQG